MQEMTLADEIKKQASPFLDAAMENFRQLLVIEYPRLRAYALEASKPSIKLNVTLNCDFSGSGVRVALESCPVVETPSQSISFSVKKA